MKKWFATFAFLALSASLHAASTAALSQETLDDIAKHEAIAAAHSAAAKCLRDGKPDAVCEGALLGACKGIAIGRFCGMKH
jgi:hypothetical protein